MPIWCDNSCGTIGTVGFVNAMDTIIGNTARAQARPGNWRWRCGREVPGCLCVKLTPAFCSYPAEREATAARHTGERKPGMENRTTGCDVPIMAVVLEHLIIDSTSIRVAISASAMILASRSPVPPRTALWNSRSRTRSSTACRPRTCHGRDLALSDARWAYRDRHRAQPGVSHSADMIAKVIGGRARVRD